MQIYALSLGPRCPLAKAVVPSGPDKGKVVQQGLASALLGACRQHSAPDLSSGVPGAVPLSHVLATVGSWSGPVVAFPEVRACSVCGGVTASLSLVAALPARLCVAEALDLSSRLHNCLGCQAVRTNGKGLLRFQDIFRGVPPTARTHLLAFK